MSSGPRSDFYEAITWSYKAVEWDTLISHHGEVFRNLANILTLRYVRTHQTNDSKAAAKWAGEAVQKEHYLLFKSVRTESWGENGCRWSSNSF